MSLKSEEKEAIADLLGHPGLIAVSKIIRSIVDKKAKAVLNHSSVSPAREKLFDVKAEYVGAKSLADDFEAFIAKLKG